MMRSIRAIRKTMQPTSSAYPPYLMIFVAITITLTLGLVINLLPPVLGQGSFSGMEPAVLATGTAISGNEEMTAGGQDEALPRVKSLPGRLLAGEQFTLSGEGFSAKVAENVVRISGVEVLVIEATPTQLVLRVPRGVAGGPLSVTTPRGVWTSQSPVVIRTSISGVVEDTARQPLSGVIVRLAGSSITAMTQSDGSFVMADVPVGSEGDGRQTLEFDASQIAGGLPYPGYSRTLTVVPNRDNQIIVPVALQQVDGPTIEFALPAGGTAGTSASQTALPTRAIQTGGVMLEVPGDALLGQTDGTSGGRLTLGVINNGRVPAEIPAGYYSSVIAQITPPGSTISPGGRLIFPNPEGYTAGTAVRLLRLDQTRNSPTLGSFVDAGSAVVSNDGRRIETAPGSITEASLYFVSAQQTTTTVTGQVVTSDNKAPLGSGFAWCRGRPAPINAGGGFSIENIPVASGDLLSVEIRFTVAGPDSYGLVRTQRNAIPAIVGGTTIVTPDIVLPMVEANQPPTLMAQEVVSTVPGQSLSFTVIASDPDAGQLLTFSASGLPSGATLNQQGGSNAQFNWTPDLTQVGTYNVTIRVTDNGSPALSTSARVAISVIGQLKWSQAAGLDGGGVADLLSIGSLTFAATRGGGVFISGNDGQLWTAANKGLTSLYVNCLTVSGTNLYAGTDSGVFISTNFGESWTTTSNALSNEMVNCLLVEGAYLYAGTSDNGVFRSFNSGTDWAPVSKGLPDNAFIASLAASNGKIFAGEVNTGLFVSDSWEMNWSLVRDNNLIQGSIGRIVTSGSRIFATDISSIYVSADNGSTWSRLSYRFDGHTIRDIAISGPDIFVAASRSFGPPTAGAQRKGGVYRSSDNGLNWVLVNNGISGRSFSTIEAVNGKVFASEAGGDTFVSINNGNDWRLASAGLTAQTVCAVTESSGRVYAGTYGGGIFLSTDGGLNWSPTNNGLTNKNVCSLVIKGGNVIAGTDEGIFISTDNGLSWRQDVGSIIYSINSILPGKGNLIAGGDSVNVMGTVRSHVLISADNGLTWKPVRGGPPIGVQSLTRNADSIIAVTFDGLYISTDDGESWSLANQSLPSQSRYFIPTRSVVASDGYLFALSWYSGVFVSADNGLNWTNASNGLTSLEVNALTVGDGCVYVGTSDGLFVSTDKGQNWKLISAEIGKTSVRSITVSGGAVFLGAQGRGIYLGRF